MLSTATNIKSVLISKKLKDELRTVGEKPDLIDKHCVVFQCDTGSYIGFTTRHLFTRIDEHRYKRSSIGKHLIEKHNTVKDNLSNNFIVLKKCKSGFDCRINEMLLIRDLKPTL